MSLVGFHLILQVRPLPRLHDGPPVIVDSRVVGDDDYILASSLRELVFFAPAYAPHVGYHGEHSRVVLKVANAVAQGEVIIK
jgi:hypothetical protein